MKIVWKLLVVVFCLLCPASVLAADGTIQFIQSSTSSGRLEGAPDGVTASFYNDNSRNKFQLMAGATMTLTLKGLPANLSLKGIRLLLKTNAKAGQGVAKAWVGDSLVTDYSIATLGDDFRDVDIGAETVAFKSTLVIQIKAFTNSVYCVRFCVDYTDKDVSGKPVDIAGFCQTFGPATLKLNDAKVVCVRGDDVFVRDASAAIDFHRSALNLSEGDVLNGVVKGQYAFTDGLPMIVGTSVQQLSVVSGNKVEARRVAADSLATCLSDLVEVHVTDREISLSDRFGVAQQNYERILPVGADGLVRGIAAQRDGLYVIYPIQPPLFLYVDSVENVYVNFPLACVELHRNFAAGQWNTLTLPFSMTAEQVAQTFGDGTLVAAFEGDDAKILNFSLRSDASIRARIPYIIWPAHNQDIIKLDSISLSDAEAGAEMVKGEQYDFVGTLNKVSPDAGSVYLAAHNKTKTLTEGGSIKAFRAYFATTAGNAWGINVTGLPSGIVQPQYKALRRHQIRYNVAGQRVTATYRGLQIIDGRKFLVR